VAEQRPDPLACPRCALRYPLEERFCARCGMPLTYAGRVNSEEPASGRHEQARKIKPIYSRGELRRVATGRQQPEAEFIQMLLLEEGVPSTLRRTAGFDVPDMLAAGPRDVLVPAAGAEPAREVLLQADLLETREARPAVERPARLLALLAILVVGLIAWVGTELLI